MVRLVLLLLLSCVNNSGRSIERPYSRLTKAEQHCMRMFQDILTIQDKRNANNILMSEATRRYNEGDITRSDHQAYFQEWQNMESQMRTEVTVMYDTAYDNGCFDIKPSAMRSPHR